MPRSPAGTGDWSKLAAEPTLEAGVTAEDLWWCYAEAGDSCKWNYDPQWIYKRVGALRLQLAQNSPTAWPLREDRHRADYKFLWVTDFPMYEWMRAKVWNAAHHPFTSPHEEDIKAGRLPRQRCCSRAGVRHCAERHGAWFGLDPYPSAGRPGGDIPLAGHERREAKERFGFFLDALEYGTPPHGALRLMDRIVMILAGAQSLREVIASRRPPSD